MTIPVFPERSIADVQRRLMAAIAQQNSPFSGTGQDQDWGGRWWEFEITAARTQLLEARALDAFFNLARHAGRFLFADPTMANPAALGTPVIDGASQTGTELITAGWTTSTTILRAGQFISLGTGDTTRLHQVTADVTSDGTGAATLPLLPPIVTAFDDASALETAAPKVLLKLASSVPASITRADVHRFSFSAREAT